MFNLRGILLAVLIVGVIGTGIWAITQPGLRLRVLGWLFILGGFGVAGAVMYYVSHSI